MEEEFKKRREIIEEKEGKGKGEKGKGRKVKDRKVRGRG